ncbi:MAG: serine hydrolase [Saprospiraceae bacterium]|nr:serine hydrolase [Saprospiraceae bacterium]
MKDTIRKENVAYHFPVSRNLANYIDTIKLNHPVSGKQITLTEYLTQTETKAFLIIQNDTLVYERYFDGYSKSSIHCTFSVSKSITSMIAGAALGTYPNVQINDPITTFIPELRKKHPYFQKLTLKDLLEMKSGLSYSTFQNWTDVFCDNNMIYYTKDQKKYIASSNFKYQPGEKRQYKSYDPILVAWVLENITHKKISDFFSEAIWKKIGTEYDAYWSVDERSGLIKASSSFHCTAIDLAKIGLLYLKGGKYQETEIIPASWIEYTVGVEMFRGKKPVIDTWWRPSQNFFWWFSTLEPIGDYYADGYKGQFLYINPNLKTIIVKFSDVGDELHDMPFRKISEALAARATNQK